MVQSSMTINRRDALRVLASGVITGVGLAIAPSAHAAPRGLKNGIDISWLPEVEKAGGKFFDNFGRQRNAISLMKAAGARVGRIRVWVNSPDGEHSLASAITLAKRLKTQGLEVCIDLHFSDTWADPAHQTLPTQWQGLTSDELLATVGAYTESTLRAFVSAGVRPQWVQIGNEITNGFLWPYGHINSGESKQWQAFVALHNAATLALRRVLPKARSVVHLDCGGDAERVRWWLSLAKTHGLLGLDVVGLSYYSQWHGSLSQLRKSLLVVASEYRLPVVIAETAYPWTSRTFGGDVIDVSKAPLSGFPLTRAGQVAYVRKLSWILRSLPSGRGVGLWWWEGFAPQMANSALVDAYGHENPAMREL